MSFFVFEFEVGKCEINYWSVKRRYCYYLLLALTLYVYRAYVCESASIVAYMYVLLVCVDDYFQFKNKIEKYRESECDSRWLTRDRQMSSNVWLQIMEYEMKGDMQDHDAYFQRCKMTRDSHAIIFQ